MANIKSNEYISNLEEIEKSENSEQRETLNLWEQKERAIISIKKSIESIHSKLITILSKNPQLLREVKKTMGDIEHNMPHEQEKNKLLVLTWNLTWKIENYYKFTDSYEILKDLLGKYRYYITDARNNLRDASFCELFDGLIKGIKESKTLESPAITISLSSDNNSERKVFHRSFS